MATTDERKLVTVLFADVVGSTELTTRHDPEPLRALLSAFFDEMRQQIEAFGGTVEKYAGDAVMAVFGVPQVHEDDAERAVRAALAMQASLAQLNPMFDQEYGVRLVLRIGIATGEAVAASGAVSEFMVTGEAPNLAARLQAAGDGITVSEATHRLLAGQVEAEPPASLALKGFPQPVTAYRVSGLRVIERRGIQVSGLSSPVVGRECEQTMLAGCLEDLRRGRGQVVVLVGEAGIGKSRLKIELRENLPEGVRWLEGRCQSYTQSTSYAPIAQVLRAAMGLGLTDAPAIARTKLRAAIRTLGADQVEQTQTALAHLLGIDLGPGAAHAVTGDPRALQARLVLASRTLLEAVAQRGPTIVAIEDLHWTDAASVDLLALWLELTDFQPLMILVTTRPETEGDAWTFRLQAERNYRHRLTELRLSPLAADDAERLADNLLRVSDLPEAIRTRILEHSEGNPFFLEEIVRGLIDEGVLRRDGERWIAAGTPERWIIPATLRGVIAARIDRLSPPAKTLLQRAAVIGRFFPYRTLRALSGEGGELDRALAALLRAELIREWTPLPDRQYVLKHALIQEAAEASLLAEQRREIHALVARHLESAGGDAGEQAAVLAHHWYHAGEWDRAHEPTLRAAKSPHRLYDRPAALGHYWRALEILDRLPATTDRQGRHADAIETLVRTPGWARDEPMLRSGLDHLDRALEHCTDHGDVARRIRLQALKGVIVRSEELLTDALARADAGGDPLTIATALDRYGFYLGSSGRWEEAIAQYTRSIALYEVHGERYQQALNITYGGRCYSARAGRLDDALAYAARFRDIAATLGDARLLAWQAMEAEPYFYLGAWGDVVRVSDENLPLAWRIGETTVILFATAWLGLAYLRLGRTADARRVVDRAAEFGRVNRDSTAYALTYLTIAGALIRLAAGEIDAALATARLALDFAERSRFPLEQGAAQRVLGQAHAAAGNRGDAHASFKRSVDILESVRSLPEVGQTLLAYGEFTRGEQPAEGAALIERATAMFQGIGATGWQAEAQRALADR